MTENIFQVRFHSRGGQGAKTAGIILAEAFIEQGEFAQTFSEYGPERSGAPMKTFLRLSEENIRLHGDVENPDMVVVLDASLLASVGVAEGVGKGGIILVNTSKPEQEIAGEIKNKGLKIYVVDASGIARELFGKNLPNTVMIGAIARLCPEISYKYIEMKLREKFDSKLSEEMIRKNLEALRRGYEAL